MLISYNITKVTPRPFVGSDGEKRDYYWYRAVRIEDGVTIDFGSQQVYEVGDNVDIHLVKYEKKDGKIGYKESSF